MYKVTGQALRDLLLQGLYLACQIGSGVAVETAEWGGAWRRKVENLGSGRKLTRGM